MRIASVDLGKSRCRVRVRGDGADAAAAGPGSPGLAAPDGVALAEDAIANVLSDAGGFDLLGVGAAGAWTAPDAAAELARRLAVRTGARVAVASDVVTAHAGALGGGPGVLLIAGTGAAALWIGRHAGTDARLVDGWGPELGDFGSGSWLGREGIRAVLRAASDLGPATALTATIRAATGDAPDPVSWLASSAQTARRLATLAPLVLDAAAAGDPVARGIADEAVRLLTASATAAGAGDVALHGGLTEHAWFRAALDGAALLAERTDLPHERHVHRAG